MAERRTNVARLIVQFPGEAQVLVDGTVRGETNHVIHLDAGEHTITLEDAATEPASHTVKVEEHSDAEEIVRVGFGAAERPVERFSPLYCCYNGFLLGQFLSLSFSRSGQKHYQERRLRMLEFLQEIEVAVSLPEQSPGLGSREHEALLILILPKVLERSSQLTDFVLLGALLTHHGILYESDPETARLSLEQIERIRKQYNLPPIDIERFVMKKDDSDVDDVLSPSLAYLGEVVGRLEVELDTAFVIMPFKQPYASYFATFYRPSLEKTGYRAFRAWGGLSNEDYCDLLLKLIGKVGLVWADVSELNYNVLYEIGAAHALGKLSMLVVSEECSNTIPANIGHDTIVRYSPKAADWPEGTVRLMAMLLTTLKFAAERGQRLRVSPEGVEQTLKLTGEMFRQLITPPEASEAAKAGRQKYEEGDYAGAELCFDEAVRLGSDDALTLLSRGTVRFALGRDAEAEADLTRALDGGDTAETLKQRMAAAYLRGMARERQENYAGARADYGAAIELGYTDVQVYHRRANVNLQLGELTEARADAERARELADDAADTLALQGDILAAEKRYQDAVAEYDKALAARPSASAEFSRALALLMAGCAEEAALGYRKGVEIAEEDEPRWALRELEQKAVGLPGAQECRAILSAWRAEKG